MYQYILLPLSPPKVNLFSNEKLDVVAEVPRKGNANGLVVGAPLAGELPKKPNGNCGTVVV